MSSLHELQKQLQYFLLSAQAAVKANILGPNQAFIAERLDIYASGYELRLLGVLASYFPGLASLAGEQLFNELGLEYINSFPSKFTNARYFGQHLVDFLTSQAVSPELLQMAKFEWTLSFVEDAADVKLLSTTDLATIPEEAWPAMQFYLHPSLQFLTLDYNIPDLWQAIQSKQALPKLQHNALQIWTLWRHELVAHYHVHSELERWFLTAIAEGQNFGAICEELGRTMPEEQAAERVVELTLTCINNQMLVQAIA
jgi:hypothetical protein